MRILGENANRDLYLGPNNQFVVLEGIDAVLQACASAIEGQRGEMQYNTSRGVPTEATLWSGSPDQQRFQFYCLDALRAVEGVKEISEFGTEVVGDALVYRATILTTFGTGSIEGIF